MAAKKTKWPFVTRRARSRWVTAMILTGSAFMIGETPKATASYIQHASSRCKTKDISFTGNKKWT